MRGPFRRALDKVEDIAVEVRKKRVYALAEKFEAVHKKVAAEAAGVADALRVGASRKDRRALEGVARWLELIEREEKPLKQAGITTPEEIPDTSSALSRLKQINAANPDPRAVETLVQLILSFRKVSVEQLRQVPTYRLELENSYRLDGALRDINRLLGRR